MEVHQIKPEYTKIVAAIPHSVSKASYWQWQADESAKKALNRWTDWFTDELFGSEMDGVTVVKANLSRFECDVERLEGESDRLCRFIRESDKPDESRKWVLGNAHRLNKYLAEWYRYRAEILAAASDEVTLIVDCHSFPSDLEPECDICIGFNSDLSKPSWPIIDLVATAFRNAGYSVAFNRPYSNALAPVGYIGHSLRIEVSKRTYMDETTLQKGGGFEHLKNTIESVYRELLWTRLNKPRCFGCPRGYPNDGTAEERSAAWEKIKESIVRYTAERYGLAMPEDMSDTDGIRKLRRVLDGNWGAPSWTHARSWLMLANVMLREVFGRVGVTLPDDAFVPHYMHHADMPKTWQAHFRSAM
jgi:N-formylglutamate amidohydrolase